MTRPSCHQVPSEEGELPERAREDPCPRRLMCGRDQCIHRWGKISKGRLNGFTPSPCIIVPSESLRGRTVAQKGGGPGGRGRSPPRLGSTYSRVGKDGRLSCIYLGTPDDEQPRREGQLPELAINGVGRPALKGLSAGAWTISHAQRVILHILSIWDDEVP